MQKISKNPILNSLVEKYIIANSKVKRSPEELENLDKNNKFKENDWVPPNNHDLLNPVHLPINAQNHALRYNLPSMFRNIDYPGIRSHNYNPHPINFRYRGVFGENQPLREDRNNPLRNSDILEPVIREPLRYDPQPEDERHIMFDGPLPVLPPPHGNERNILSQREIVLQRSRDIRLNIDRRRRLRDRRDRREVERGLGVRRIERLLADSADRREALLRRAGE
mmetsp:Transcript_7858/g.8990  ORF Transcript_7858/g.8990 Transcript_7858/m.8990 type:complete len:224 (-) Transcript_7858:24-695(-)